VSSPVRLALARILEVALRLSGRRAGLVLVYHAVEERPGDRSRELVPAHGLEQFESQLRHLRTRYRLVPATGLLTAVAARRPRDRFPVAITFDDDLPSHARVVAPRLAAVGAPATFFLCGASLELPFSFWWERLQRAVDVGRSVPIEGDGIHEIARRIEVMSPAERDAVAERLRREVGPEPQDVGLRSSEVQRLVEAGNDIGFHTLRHDSLTHLSDDELVRAMTHGRSALEAAAGRRLVTIAYPHGKADGRVAEAARDAGFRFGFTGLGEPVVPGSDPLRLGRIEPTFGSLGEFAIQLVTTILSRSHR